MEWFIPTAQIFDHFEHNIDDSQSSHDNESPYKKTAKITEEWPITPLLALTRYKGLHTSENLNWAIFSLAEAKQHHQYGNDGGTHILLYKNYIIIKEKSNLGS